MKLPKNSSLRLTWNAVLPEVSGAFLVFPTKAYFGGQKKALALPDVTESALAYQKGDVLELDELWSYVYRRADKCWVWIALCRRTRQVVSWVIGKRDEERCQALWDLLPTGYQQSMVYTDFYAAYAKVLSAEGANFECVGKDSGQTNHVERWNCTLRQRVGRFVRKTLSFSKCIEMHELMLKLFIHYYNESLVL
ncbi:MAG: IS1 family transposase [Bacteroidota bacterium]